MFLVEYNSLNTLIVLMIVQGFVMIYIKYFCFYTNVDSNSCTSGTRFSSLGNGSLPSGDSINIGNVQVCLNGTYAPVCSDFVDDDFAQFVCYQQYGSLDYSEHTNICVIEQNYKAILFNQLNRSLAS